MTPFLNDARVAELWARVRQKLDPATDKEVEELLDEIFGAPPMNEMEEKQNGEH